MSFRLRTHARIRVGLVALFAMSALRASAQVVRPQQLETRAGLMERAAREESAGHRATAAVIRARLLDGDYQVGHRVIIELENMPAGRAGGISLIRPDTLAVRSGRTLQFPQSRYEGVQDLPVGGLLRSELPDTVRKHLAAIYKNPIVRVTSLVGISVTGAVGRNGFHDVSPDMRLNDVFTTAGGLAANADLKKIVIRRGVQNIMTGKEVQNAIDAGVTVDGAQLRDGDQINVPIKSTSNMLTYAGLAMSVITMTLALTRGR